MRAPWTLFIRVCQREIMLNMRQLKGMLHVFLFFLMLLIFFPLTLKPEPALLRAVIPGLVWMSMLLAYLLSADRMFQKDYENGVIEQWLLSAESLELIVAGKILVHWLINLVPVLILFPLIALFFSLSVWESVVLVLSLLCGTASLLFLCALASVFALGLSQRSALVALILLPLTLPVMIFGSASMTASMQGLPVSGYLAALSAFSILSFAFIPFAIAEVLRIGGGD